MKHKEIYYKSKILQVNFYENIITAPSAESTVPPAISAHLPTLLPMLLPKAMPEMTLSIVTANTETNSGNMEWKFPPFMDSAAPTVSASMLVAIPPRIMFFHPLRSLTSIFPLAPSRIMETPTYPRRSPPIMCANLLTIPKMRPPAIHPIRRSPA